MRFKTIAFALIVSSAAFILGCDDDDDSSSIPVEDKTIFFQVTFDPPLDSATASLGAAGVSGSISEFVGSQFAPVTVTSFTTEELAVTKGENLTVYVSAYGFGSSNYCSNVQVKALLNGSQFDVHTYNMGGYSALTTCPDGFQQTYNLIIP